MVRCTILSYEDPLNSPSFTAEIAEAHEEVEDITFMYQGRDVTDIINQRFTVGLNKSATVVFFIEIDTDEHAYTDDSNIEYDVERSKWVRFSSPADAGQYFFTHLHLYN